MGGGTDEEGEGGEGEGAGGWEEEEEEEEEGDHDGKWRGWRLGVFLERRRFCQRGFKERPCAYG